MNLYSGDPYWLIKNGYQAEYTSLNKNCSCDVAIIGGGITGAVMAYYLKKSGADVIIIDRRHIGFGSTCASTALLQYEIDTPLTDLKKMIGEKNANESYLLCVKAIHELKKICNEISVDCKFKLKKSLYLATYKSHVVSLENEFLARKNIGIKLKLLYEPEIKNLIGINAPAALYSEDGGQMDPYLFTQGLFNYLNKKGCKIYDLTEVIKIKERSEAQLICSNGSVITCKKFIFANGYESSIELKKKIIDLNSTYVVISKPLSKEYLRFLKPLIWESNRPYMYIRTAGNRIIVGGKDAPFYNPQKRDLLIGEKSEKLKETFLKKFLFIPFEIDFSWAGTFANTEDGLPYIGHHDRYKHGYAALGFGGNGIVFSQIAGKVISEMFSENKPYPLFSFERTKKNL